MKASIKPVLLKHKKLSSGKYPVFLRVTIDRKIKYFKIGADFNCLEREWSKKEGYFKSVVKDAGQMNEYIDETVQKARKVAIKLEKNTPNYSIEDFSLAYTRKGNALTVLSYFDDVVMEMEKNGDTGNADIYKQTKNRFKAFLESISINTDISFETIKPKLLNGWVNFLRKTCSDTTIHLRLRTLRALNNMAKEEEGVDYYAFENYSLAFLDTKTPKRALKLDELKELFKYKADPNKSEYHSLNYFKFMYLCRGMNFIDLCLLKKEGIKKEEFEYIRMKTGKKYTVPLYDVIKEIITIYSFITQDSEYVFPILKESHNTPRKIKERVTKKRDQVNKDLKDIAKELGIEKNLTTYVSRHTFATILKYLGESTELISEQLGHADPKTTQTYLDSFTDETLKDSTEKAIKAAVS